MSARRLRPATAADAEFIYATLREGIREYVVQTWGEWDEAWQRESFESGFDAAVHQVVSLGGRDVGFIATREDADAICLDRIYIAAAHRNLGLGAALVRDLLALAVSRNLPLRLRVLRVNPAARRLYERLGFARSGESATHYEMEAQPG